MENKRTMIGPLILPERTIYRDKKKKKTMLQHGMQKKKVMNILS